MNRSQRSRLLDRVAAVVPALEDVADRGAGTAAGPAMRAVAPSLTLTLFGCAPSQDVGTRLRRECESIVRAIDQPPAYTVRDRIAQGGGLRLR